MNLLNSNNYKFKLLFPLIKLLFASFLIAFSNPKLVCAILHKAHPGWRAGPTHGLWARDPPGQV